MDDVVCGALSGLVTRSLTAPLDLVKIRMQLNLADKKSIYSLVSSILRDEGIWAFWKGNLAGSLLYISYSSVQFGTFYFVKNELGCENSFVGGSIASSVALAASFPLDTLRTRLASKMTKQSMLNLKMWKFPLNGLTPSLLSVAPYMGCTFYFFDVSLKLLNATASFGLSNNLIAGFVAGTAAKSLTYPIDVLKKHLQVELSNENFIRGSMRACRLIYEKKGFFGFYQGLSASTVKSGLSSAIAFWSFHFFKENLNRVNFD